MFAKSLLLIITAALAVSGCSKKTTPIGDAGVCYHVVPQKDGTLKYNRVLAMQSLEACAGNLEALRVKFLRMGGNQTDIYGAYQANFLFLVKEGVMTSTSLEGPRYVALVRTGDGRLAIPGAMPR